MNGIIHPCVHPESRDAPETEEAMIEDIFEYIDIIFGMVRPRRLLYMAIDGVAPRAKMNQQRSRRFKSIQEAQERARVEQLMIEEMELQFRNKGKEPPIRKEKKAHFDYNCITPGTSFMDKIAQALRYYVSARQSTDPGWKGVQVIISDATVPGEGEHKLMEFIRAQRTNPDYDPNTVHCIYGLDADLIMLTMATHESRFSVLREEVTNKRQNVCRRCGQPGHQEAVCTGKKQRQDYLLQGTQFQFLDVPTLKEYLEIELMPAQPLSFEWNVGRACDDFVLLCFLVGNDFLPHMPTLSIREGAIDLLMALYKSLLPEMGGWMSCNGKVDFPRLGMLLKRVAPLEDQILQNQIQDEKSNQDRREANLRRSHSTVDIAAEPTFVVPVIEGAEEEAEKLLDKLLRDRKEAASKAPIKNEVRLGEPGWRDRYYRVKFHREGGLTDSAFIKGVAESFIRGIAWVLEYYYQGVSDWEWYFEYHYAPFASDLDEFVDWVTFDPKLAPQGSTAPFLPLQQLMAVLPPQSAWCLPPCFARLMSAPDSPILDYYPEHFAVDMEGIPANLSYLGIVLLPFIDSKRLIDATTPLTPQLTEAEASRNRVGKNFLFANSAQQTKVVGAMKKCINEQNLAVPVRDGGKRANLFGIVTYFPDYALRKLAFNPPWSSAKLKVVMPNLSLCCYFDWGERPESGYTVGPLAGAQTLHKVLTADDAHRRMPPSRGASGRLSGMATGNPTNDGYQARRHPQQHQQQHQGGGAGWVCVRCQRKNVDAASNCYVCDLPLAENNSAVVAPWTDWSCVSCLSMNRPYRWDCEKCRTRKPGMPVPKSLIRRNAPEQQPAPARVVEQQQQQPFAYSGTTATTPYNYGTFHNNRDHGGHARYAHPPPPLPPSVMMPPGATTFFGMAQQYQQHQAPQQQPPPPYYHPPQQYQQQQQQGWQEQSYRERPKRVEPPENHHFAYDRAPAAEKRHRSVEEVAPVAPAQQNQLQKLQEMQAKLAKMREGLLKK